MHRARLRWCYRNRFMWLITCKLSTLCVDLSFELFRRERELDVFNLIDSIDDSATEIESYERQQQRCVDAVNLHTPTSQDGTPECEMRR